jgi:hypothetical protein
MVRLVRLMALVAAVVTLGCAPTLKRDQPFSRDWAFHGDKDPAQEESGELVLTGKSGKGPKTALLRDEEGETQLRVGRNSGFHTDVEIHSGNPEVEVKYKWEW